MNLTQLADSLGLSPDMLVTLAVPMVGGLIILMVALLSGGESKDYKRRLTKVRNKARSGAKPGEQQVSVKRTTIDSEIAFFDRLIKRLLPRREELRKRLARAGLKISLGTYVLICMIVGIAAFTLSQLTSAIPLLASILAGLSAGVALPYGVLKYLEKRRQNKFLDNFPEAIDLITRGLKSGLPIGESIKTAGEEVPDPVGCELKHVTDAVRMGEKLEDVLGETSERLGIQEFKFFTISLAIQSETGGNLAETLGNLSDVLRKRRQLKLKIKALSSEAKASAYIIGSLPFLMAVFIYLINPEYISALVIDPRGHIMIGMGLTSFVVGAGVMYKMVKFDY